MDDRVVIALFRHGVTEENKRKAYLGWNDSPLSPETKDRVSSKNYEHYYSSDLQRCVKTGERLFSNASIKLIKELREMNFGQWEGKTYEELKENVHYRNWLKAPNLHIPPKGESYQEFTQRVDSGWTKITDEVLRSNLNSCAVITHGGVIRYLLSRFAPDRKEFWAWQVNHDQGYELIFEREALRRGERCILLLEVPLTAKGHG
ncbi:histidine phosphatase family protein [Neobacillus sp. MER 74]|uniref:histidine phosphatase family protein n=1 Tax=Neobacillus sp. MER 74 TaxID=2939566 RepID=UPI00203C9C98|nr:histidine phosphatase family protein [Neobacillus sp. MER 74]MCM3116878.1 histidine phosphatase family protein [Neobacillus sp. MER 74]